MSLSNKKNEYRTIDRLVPGDLIKDHGGTIMFVVANERDVHVVDGEVRGTGWYDITLLVNDNMLETSRRWGAGVFTLLQHADLS